jgi:FkbM family methyltransferase
MNIKLEVGRLINQFLDTIIKYNYKLVPFIPNGRILTLDLKRAKIYPLKIFDVGANIGQTANYFLEHFSETEIYCFEPVQSTFQKLTANVKSGRIHLFNEGLGSNRSIEKIHINDSSASSSLLEDDGRFFASETVKINTGCNFCEENKINEIDLLKIDVEGYELQVLSGFESMLKNVKMIYAEVGFDKNDKYKTYLPELLEFCDNHGFIMSGFYESFRWGNGKFNFFCNILLVNRTLIV